METAPNTGIKEKAPAIAQQIKTDRYPNRWKKGQSGNPKGAPVSRPEIQILRDALAETEKKKGKHIIQHAIMRAYEDDGVLIAILKKLLPDKSNVDLGGAVQLLDKYRGWTIEQLDARYRELSGHSN